MWKCQRSRLKREMVLEPPRRDNPLLAFQGRVVRVRGLLGLDLIFRHDGGGAAGLAFFVDPAIDDLYALEIFLNDLFSREFDVLFRLSSSPLANSVDHVLFHQDPNLLG